jgi:UDP-2,3-diacylglucosamine pyrophosphatase LpxH
MSRVASSLKQRVGNAVRYIAEFEHALAQAARRQGLDGVVCGHIHRPGIREVGGVLYCNDGDWVESCTAIAEHRDGRLELLDWAATARREAAAGTPALEPAA